MKYSGFLLSSAAAAMITILAQVPVWAADTIRVSYETTDTHLKARTVAIFKKELESTSGGKLSVETYPGATNPIQTRGVSSYSGAGGSYRTFISYYESITPKAKLLTTPLVFRGYEHLMKAMEGEVGASIFADLEAKGLKPLGFWYETPTVVFTSKTKVETLDDIKGLKIRTYPSATLESMLGALGANPTVIPGNEVYMALQNGVVDGAVTTPSFAVSMKLDEVLKYITDIKLVFGGYIFAMNKSFYDGLSSDMQTKINDAAKVATAWNQKEIYGEIDVSLDKAAKNGVSVLPASEKEIARWQAAMKSVHDGADPAVKKLMQMAASID